MTQQGVVVLRPLISRLSNRYGLSLALLIVPPLIVLYVLTIPHGTWAFIVGIHVVIVIVIVLLSRGLHRAKLEVSADGIVETGFLSRRAFTQRADIASTLVLTISDGNSPRTYTQVFVLDSAGRTRVRLRGQYWGADAIDEVAGAFDVPIERLDEPTSIAALRRTQPQTLYWHERHPILRAILLGAGVLIVGVPTFWYTNTLFGVS